LPVLSETQQFFEVENFQNTQNWWFFAFEFFSNTQNQWVLQK
jgi:hypothetical protein